MLSISLSRGSSCDPSAAHQSYSADPVGASMKSTLAECRTSNVMALSARRTPVYLDYDSGSVIPVMIIDHVIHKQRRSAHCSNTPDCRANRENRQAIPSDRRSLHSCAA